MTEDQKTVATYVLCVATITIAKKQGNILIEALCETALPSLQAKVDAIQRKMEKRNFSKGGIV